MYDLLLEFSVAEKLSPDRMMKTVFIFIYDFRGKGFSDKLFSHKQFIDKLKIFKQGRNYYFVCFVIKMKNFRNCYFSISLHMKWEYFYERKLAHEHICQKNNATLKTCTIK